MLQTKWIIRLLTALLICAAAGGAFVYYQFTEFRQHPARVDAGQMLFKISPGQSLETIAIRLEKDGIITNQRFFIWLAMLEKADKKLQAGEYLLSGSQSPDALLTTLLSGKVRLYKLTIPEGLTITEIAGRIEKAGYCSRQAFIELCNDPQVVASFHIKGKSLEGFLYPDTYFFPGQTDCRTVAEAMVDRFKTVFTEEWRTRAKALGMNVYEVVTLASIIEKETGDASERPVIASVFHNRLKKKMRLESDPTVIYGIKNFDGNIRRIHLRTVTPYNTYQIKGLPAGPIANPGALAIKAALYPAETDYLFFVSKKDTTHYFSKTIKEHNRAVRKYQLNR